jgi:hypothetical protein
MGKGTGKSDSIPCCRLEKCEIARLTPSDNQAVMTHDKMKTIGILPSLEVLPFFDAAFMEGVNLSYAAHASYGSIAREMLVGNLAGGIMPWEIFVSDVFSLPGQRNQWAVAFFSKPGLLELVLQTKTHRNIRPEGGRGTQKKSSTKLQIGVESRNSLTCRHFMEWLEKAIPLPRPEVAFRFLPMDQRLQSLPADALDGFIARSPWGHVAEERDIGKRQEDFSQAAAGQPLVTVCRREVELCVRLCAETIPILLSEGRRRLSDPVYLESAAGRLDASGKPRIPFVFLAEAAKTQNIANWDDEMPADIEKITSELQALGRLGHLPAQIAANEQTARLLSYS